MTSHQEPSELDKAASLLAYPVKYSSLGTYIFGADGLMIADVRGWGWIQKLENPEQTQDEIGEFIAQAINEKLERQALWGKQ